MKRNTYLQILTEIFFETLCPVKSEIAEPFYELRKKMFLTELTRRQKLACRDFFVTKEDFKMQLLLALDELKETVAVEGFRYSNAWCSKNEYLNADYNWERNGHGYNKDRFEEVLKLETECEKLEDLYIELNSIFPFLRGSFCGRDANYIEWVLEEFILFTDEKTKPEPLVLSDTSVNEKNIIIIKEQYGEMFTNNGFKLFDHILSEYIKPKNTTGRYEDLSYYYRRLFEDKFIHQKPEPFKLWFNNKYGEDFSKIKTKIQTTNPQRQKDYSNALDWCKLQNH